VAELIYGLKDDKLIHINDVQQGRECNCICPNCGANLVAKKGRINEHHFAHESKECDITIAQETVLHLIAKDIFSEAKTIKLPKVILEDKFAFLDKNKYKSIPDDIYLQNKIEKYKDSIKVIDNVILEKYIDNIKPDILLEINGKKLIVEIAVTHFINNKKKEKIINIGIPTIEIDLSSYKNKINSLTKDDLNQILIKDDKYKKWIYYDNYVEDINTVITKNNKIIDKLNWLSEYYKQNFTKEYRFNYNHNNLNDKHFKNYWNKLQISKTMLVPWFINYPIDGDILFKVDRRIWQALIIDKLHGNRNINIQFMHFVSLKNMSRHPDYHIWAKTGEIYDNPLIELKLVDAKTLTKNNKTIEDVVKNYYRVLQENRIVDFDKNDKKYMYSKSPY